LGIEFFPTVITGVNSVGFSVPKNSSVGEIAEILRSKKVIIDPFGFTLIVRALKSDRNLKSGNYRISRVKNVFEIISVLEEGVPQKQVKVTIPEGFTVYDIARRLKENGIIANENDFIEKAKQFEGYLFPDTYFFYKGESPEKIIDAMKSRFYEVLPGNYEEMAKKKGLTLKEAVILASIVEKEAKFDKDRPLVASVFLNRLKIGMPLQSDATVNYALKSNKLWLSQKDLDVDSPYNTYKYVGLPPGPICNPGLKSLLAVVNAPKTDYYYFLTKPDGEAVFERTLEEHNRNIRKYYGG
jgi:UPF0755 protein